jgi:glucosylceramidase
MLVLLGCSSSGNSNGGVGGNASGGTSDGGSSGNPSGGAGGNANGGTSDGGSSGNPSGGAGGNASGGASNGGSSGNPNGGAGGNASGAAAGTRSGGAAGSASGGASTGGSKGSGGVAGLGGAAPPSGGSQTGGTQGAGGAGAGGSSVSVNALVTSAQGAYWKPATWTEVTSNVTVLISDGKTYQTWEGFGGAFNEKGWSYLSMLSPGDRDQALSLLFGDDGARFNMGRIPIGANDYSMDRYTLDEVPSGSDPSMASFSMTRDQQYLIPFIKAAMAVRPSIRFWASPWTPPTWMKNGPFQSSYPFDGGNMKTDDTTLKALALYLVKFVQEYQKLGIKIDAVAPQNEPTYKLAYPTCVWDPATFAKFIGQYLGPAVDSAGLDTKIMLGTLSNNAASGGDTDIANAVLGDAAARGYCKVVGVQWNMADSGHVSAIQGKLPAAPFWLTETVCGNFYWDSNYKTTAPNDHAYGIDVWGQIRNAIKTGISAFNAWNMVLDTVGNSIDASKPWAQNALLTVDTAAKKLNITPAYYAFRHFSQFVEVDAKRIDATGGDAVAFKNPDGSLVAVMYNAGSASTYTVSIGGKRLQFAMPGSGWATLKYKP